MSVMHFTELNSTVMVSCCPGCDLDPLTPHLSPIPNHAKILVLLKVFKPQRINAAIGPLSLGDSELAGRGFEAMQKELCLLPLARWGTNP